MYIRVPEKGCWLILTSHLQGEGRETDTDKEPSTHAAAGIVTTGKHIHTHQDKSRGFRVLWHFPNQICLSTLSVTS